MVHFLFARARGVERSLWGEGLGYVCKRAYKLFCKQELEIKHQRWSLCEGWGAVLSLGGREVTNRTDNRARNSPMSHHLCFSQNLQITPVPDTKS